MENLKYHHHADFISKLTSADATGRADLVSVVGLDADPERLFTV